MPYKLGAQSLARLEGVEPRLVAVVKAAIDITAQDFAVHEGVRSYNTQVEYVRRGVSKTLRSKHLEQPDGFGHAVDLVPYVDGKLRWEWEPIYRIASAMREAAKAQKVKLVWGGVWDRALNDIELGPLTGPAAMKKAVEAYCARHPGPDFIDGPHYQLET